MLQQRWSKSIYQRKLLKLKPFGVGVVNKKTGHLEWPELINIKLKIGSVKIMAVVTFGEVFCFLAGCLLTYVFIVTEDIDKEEKRATSKTNPRRVNGFKR